MELYRNRIGSCLQHGRIRCEGRTLGRTRIGTAIGQITVISVFRNIEGCGFLSINVDHRCVIVYDRALQLHIFRNRIQGKGCPEKESGNIVSAFAVYVLI